MSSSERAEGGFRDGAVRMGIISGVFMAVICLCILGPLAVLENPYLLPALAFLGTGGLACGIGACMFVLPGGEGVDDRPRGFRALGFLAGAFGFTAIVWSQARPDGGGLGFEVILFGVVLSAAVIAGIAALMILPLMILLAGESEDENQIRLVSGRGDGEGRTHPNSGSTDGSGQLAGGMQPTAESLKLPGPGAFFLDA